MKRAVQLPPRAVLSGQTSAEDAIIDIVYHFLQSGRIKPTTNTRQSFNIYKFSLKGCFARHIVHDETLHPGAWLWQLLFDADTALLRESGQLHALLPALIDE